MKRNVVQCAILAIFAAGAGFAQSADQCTLEPDQILTFETLDASREGMLFDAAGGIDTFNVGTARTIIPRTDRMKSIEVFDLRNDLFTTVIIDTEVLATSDTSEIEVIGDPYDYVILDPRYTWDRQVDYAYTGIEHITEFEGTLLTVRTGFDAYVVGDPGAGILIQQGPGGDIRMPRGHGMNARPQAENISLDGERTIIKWDDVGIMIADLTSLEPTGGVYELNTQNGVPNALVIDIRDVVGAAPRELFFVADEEDRLILLQEPCWSREDAAPLSTARMVTLRDAPQKLTIIADAQHFAPGRLAPFVRGTAHEPGVRHLSAESRRVVDFIDLKNGGKDVMIIRNTAHLRKNFPVFVSGDPNLDEVWLEGSAGWTLEFRDTGTFATIPTGLGSKSVLWFAPGLRVTILPPPPFLMDQSLLDLAFYPGLQNERTGHGNLIISRSGYVALSAVQLAGRRQVSTENGAATMIKISPDLLIDSQDEVAFFGDPGKDILLLEAMPPYQRDEDGVMTWRIARPDQRIQTITATGFHLTSQIAQ